MRTLSLSCLSLSLFIFLTETQAFNHHHLSSLNHISRISSSSSSYISSSSLQINQKLNTPWGASPSLLKMTPFFDEIENEETSNNKPFIETELNLSNTELIINAALVTFCFSFALYTIFNIDQGMTRGWTQAETLVRMPVDSWKGYEDSLAAKPLFTKTMLNTIVYLLGDWLSQTLFKKRNVLDFEYKRTMRNGCIGAMFGAYAHKYYEFSDWVLPMTEPINKLYKIGMDQTLFMGSKIGTFLFMVVLLAGGTFEESVDNVKTKLKDVMLTAWRFWPFVHCITYTVIPTQHRLLWVAGVDLFWQAILAVLARGGSIGSEEEEGAAVADITNTANVNDVNTVEENMLENAFFFADTVSSYSNNTSAFIEMRDLDNMVPIVKETVAISNDTTVRP